MRRTIILLFGAVICIVGSVQSRSRRTTPSFSEPDDDAGAFPENNDGNDDGRNSGSSSFDQGATTPDFVRVEIEIQRLENPGGILANGKKCDFFKSCDPRVTAYIDADKPLSPFPGALPTSKWPTLFEASNTNSPTIGKSVNKDVCGGSFGKVNLRVHVVDVDVFTANDFLMDFNCIFDVDPRDIAGDAQSANWGPSTECQATGQNGKIKLFVRERAYQIPSSDCQAAENSRLAGSLASEPLTDSRSVGHHVPGQHDYIRVDVELVQLLNPQGVAATGKACDLTGACDPVITAYLDIDKPLAAWPGSKTVPEYTRIFKASNVNSPIINKNVSRDICGGSVNKINLRVHVVDADTLSHSDPIADFQCLFTVDYRLISRDISSSDWSPTQDCQQVPADSKNDIRLQYRFRLYDIQTSECGIKSR